MISVVPPGGNWKNIPESIPSKRLAQIRESYANREGSRSTYYGRLRWDRPAYTISTCFNRPGNGCHIHPAADRLITVREAARIQSFPDWYHFHGAKTSIYKQVGNAVPPLLAFVIAKQLRIRNFVNLYCGAGGMSLGFEEAGATPILAADIDEQICETYRRNRERDPLAVLTTDLSTEKAKRQVAKKVHEHVGSLDAVIGGPPCQGFSHAGNARTPEDPRNRCVFDFIDLVKVLKPRIVVMENVPGIMTLERGRAITVIRERFAKIRYPVSLNILSAVEFGIPQRRKRVFLIASDEATRYELKGILSADHQVSVFDAISDLPLQPASSDEERVEYVKTPQTHYQRMLRGHITYENYMRSLSSQADPRKQHPTQYKVPLLDAYSRQ